MYNVSAKLNGIKSIVCIRIKGGENKYLRMESCVRQGCVMSHWLFNVYMDAVMKEVKMEMRRMGVRFLEGREWRLSRYLHTDELVLCSELEDLRVMVGQFVEQDDGTEWRRDWSMKFM